MDKNPFVGASILVIIFLILGSLSNVVGYQTVYSSKQNLINEEINQKELLFQTIVDLANNKEIQRILFLSQMKSTSFFESEAKFTLFNIPVFTKNHIRQLYRIGLLLAQRITPSKINSLLKKDQSDNQVILKQISIVIEKNDKLNKQLDKLSFFSCDCEKSYAEELNKLIYDSSYKYRPVVCVILILLLIPLYLLFIPAEIMLYVFNPNPFLTPIAAIVYAFTLPLILAIDNIGYEFKCWKISYNIEPRNEFK